MDVSGFHRRRIYGDHCLAHFAALNGHSCLKSRRDLLARPILPKTLAHDIPGTKIQKGQRRQGVASDLDLLVLRGDLYESPDIKLIKLISDEEIEL